MDNRADRAGGEDSDVRSYGVVGPAPAPPKSRRLRLAVMLLVVAGAIGGTWWYLASTPKPVTTSGRFRGGPEGTVPVLATAVTQRDVPVTLDGVGTTRALNTVTVRPQVDGKLMKILFREGQDVARGDVIAQIDPATYQAQYDQAVAKKAQDEAQLVNARLDLDRYRKLAASNAGPKQQADTQQATVNQLEALVQADQAQIDNARTVLSYTNITAPIAGRTGLRQVDEGNLVHASDTTGIVVITQIKPIAVLFNLPQQQVSRINTARAGGPLSVDVIAGDNTTVIDSGPLQVMDNQIDPTTGTIRLKAELPNGKLQLWPGQFVNVRLRIDTLKDALVVPTGAVQRGPTGPFVYVVQDDNKAVMRPITVTQQDEQISVIESGVTVGQRVVTSGFNNLSDGATVEVQAGAATPPPLPSRMKGGGRGPGGPGGPGGGPGGPGGPRKGPPS